MEAMVERVAGLDVHKEKVVACTLTGAAEARPRKELRTFGTFTRELCELRDWLVSQGITHVVMESTGPYWKPVYAVLEEASLTLVVGNATHMKNVPGRKTDANDAEWIASLGRMGLVRASFVPPKQFRATRELIRYRRSLVEERSAERNRVQKLLESMNVKLGSVASDVFGKSGRAMLAALIAGTAAPAEMAKLAQGHLRKKLPELEAALDGRFDETNRFILARMLHHVDELDADVVMVEKKIDALLQSVAAKREALCAIPGISLTLAAAVLAEVGTDMKVFGTPHRLAAWAGVCPGNNESAGKQLGSKKRKGNVYLMTSLVEAAQAAVKTKDSYYRDKFFRLKARRGYKRAIVAIAHKILIACFQILSTGAPYKELGAAYLDGLDKERTVRNLVRRLERLGHAVQLAATTPREAKVVG